MNQLTTIIQAALELLMNRLDLPVDWQKKVPSKERTLLTDRKKE